MNEVMVEGLMRAFVDACVEVFGAEKIEGIVVHGSAVKGGAIPGFSDLDFQVYLSPECFADVGHVSLEQALAMQEKVATLPVQTAGVSYVQAYFHDWRRMPEGWVGPAPGSYRELLGALPEALKPTAEQYRAAARRHLTALPGIIGVHLTNFADSADSVLPRRVRVLGTEVTPAIFTLLTVESDDPLRLWAMPKQEALALLERRYEGELGPKLARSFYEDVAVLFGGDFEVTRARSAFRAGIEFLQWASEVSGRA